MKIRLTPVRGKRRLASMETSVKLQAEKAFKNAVTFAPRSGAKVLASLPGSLARQCFRGIRFHARRAAAPLALPRPGAGEFCSTKVFRHAERKMPLAKASGIFRFDFTASLPESRRMIPMHCASISSRRWRTQNLTSQVSDTNCVNDLPYFCKI